MKTFEQCRAFLCMALLLAAAGCAAGPQAEPQAEPSQAVAAAADLGPQSQKARGELRVLMLAVRFPDVAPSRSLDEIRTRAAVRLNEYVKDQSYGQARVAADLVGWVPLPDPIERYAISPDNFKVDRSRVRKLIEDAMSAVEGRIDFAAYDHMLIIPGAATIPGKGYGMICYCANPGMLTGVRGQPAYLTLRAKGGREFSGGIFVGTENAHLGMFAHDFFHALGGVHADARLVPCLYDFQRQAEASRRHRWEECTTFMGPWDVMSAHFVDKQGPPPGLSAFTRIRLGWIHADQVVQVPPGETRQVSLWPLAEKGKTLAVKIPLAGGRYYLVENRQPIGFDRVLPDAGLLVVRVDPGALEGTGTARIMDADPSAFNFQHATYKPGAVERSTFVDRRSGIAVVALSRQGDRMEVLITTPEGAAAAR